MSPSRTITAAASRYIDRKITRGRAPPTAPWQTRAWQMYKAVPEDRFAAMYIANAMPRATRYAARRADDGTIETAPDGHHATEIVSEIAGGPDGQAKMLTAFGKHLTVPDHRPPQRRRPEPRQPSGGPHLARPVHT